MDFGDTLRLLRLYHDLKQNEVADKLGVSKSLISELESGKKKAGLEILRKYAEGFEIPLSGLIMLSEQEGGRETDSLLNPRKYLAKKILQILEWIDKKNPAP